MSVFPSVRQKDRWILQQGLTHRLSGTVLLLRNSSRSEMTVAAQAHPGLAYSWSFIPPTPILGADCWPCAGLAPCCEPSVQEPEF